MRSGVCEIALYRRKQALLHVNTRDIWSRGISRIHANFPPGILTCGMHRQIIHETIPSNEACKKRLNRPSPSVHAWRKRGEGLTPVWPVDAYILYQRTALSHSAHIASVAVAGLHCQLPVPSLPWLLLLLLLLLSLSHCR